MISVIVSLLQLCIKHHTCLWFGENKMLFQGEHAFTEVRTLLCQESREMYTDATKPNKVSTNFMHVICKCNQPHILRFIFIFPLSELPVGEVIGILFS